MKLYEQVFQKIRVGTPVRQIQQELNLPLSRLQRVLRSKRFQRYMEIQRETTRAFVALSAADQVGWIVERLWQLFHGRNEDSARKVCYALLNTLLDGRHNRPLSSTVPNVLAPDAMVEEFVAACRSAAEKNKPDESEIAIPEHSRE
ncbi:MAG: hypothetical protein JXA11_06390 [Phycisphaerae bacterium]|nr:hypothetical protein [Phycisphaerae bacterium]